MLTNAECVFCREPLALSGMSRSSTQVRASIATPAWWNDFDQALLGMRIDKSFNHIYLKPGDRRSRVVINICIPNVDTAVACHLDCLVANQRHLRFIIESMSRIPPIYLETLPASYANPAPDISATIDTRYQELLTSADGASLRGSQISWADQVERLRIERKYVWPKYSISKLQTHIESRWDSIFETLEHPNRLKPWHCKNSFNLSQRLIDITIDAVPFDHIIWLGFEPIVHRGVFASIAAMARSAPTQPWQPVITAAPAYSAPSATALPTCEAPPAYYV